MTPAAARCIAQPGLALATTVAPRGDRARAIAASLRSRISPASSGCSARVGAARTAAQAVVVELDHVGDAAEHGAHRARGPSARGAGGTGPARSPGPSGAARLRAGGRRGRRATRGRRAHACAERHRLGGADEVAVVLHRRTASGRVDHDRRRRRASTAITRSASAAAWSCKPAWTCSAPQQPPRFRRPSDGDAGGARAAAAVARCVARSQASITQPVNSHTSGRCPAARRGRRAAGVAAARRARRSSEPADPPAAPGGRAGRRPAPTSRRAAADGGRAGRRRRAASAG